MILNVRNNSQGLPCVNQPIVQPPHVHTFLLKTFVWCCLKFSESLKGVSTAIRSQCLPGLFSCGNFSTFCALGRNCLGLPRASKKCNFGQWGLETDLWNYLLHLYVLKELGHLNLHQGKKVRALALAVEAPGSALRDASSGKWPMVKWLLNDLKCKKQQSGSPMCEPANALTTLCLNIPIRWEWATECFKPVCEHNLWIKKSFFQEHFETNENKSVKFHSNTLWMSHWMF